MGNPVVTTPPALEVQSLSYVYPDGRKALDGVSFSVAPGERVGLLGSNGAGKSTLLLHLNGTLQGQGLIRVSGTVVERSSLGLIRGRTGLVFQDPDDQLFSLTLEDDVAFGPVHMGLDEAEVTRRVAAALKAVGLEAHGRRPPHHLSGGEKKRGALATVLSMSPDLLALDEPTTGLDSRGRREMVQLLGALPQAQLIASHDMRLVWVLCHRVLILDSGRVMAEGPTHEILSDEDLLSRHGLEGPETGPVGPSASEGVR